MHEIADIPAATASAAAAAARPRLSLDGAWDFWMEHSGPLAHDALPAQPDATVTVPGPWQAHPDLRRYTGVGWMQRRFDAAPLPPGAVAFVHFGAVDENADVWLNGVHLGRHEGGSLPFALDATAGLQPGANLLTVRIEDALEEFAETPHGKQSWYGMLSGIWQSVALETRAAVHIAALQARAVLEGDDGRITVALALNTPLPDGHTLRLALRAPDGAAVAESAAAGAGPAFLEQLDLANPTLWEIEAPRLYTLSATVADALGAPLDAQAQQVGFRTIATQAGRLLLNGRPLYLRAALDQDYYPDGFGTLPSANFIEESIRAAQAMGLNCLRVHIKIADPRYYDAADRLGMLIWTEMPNWALLTEKTEQRARTAWEAILARDGHHASIIIWTLINESWGVDLTNPEHRRWLRASYDWLKQADPTRLVVGNSACSGNFHVVSDLEDFHNYYAMPDHADKWARWVASLASRPSWTYAFDYPGVEAWRRFAADPWTDHDHPPAPENSRTGEEPILVSEFGNWSLPDVPRLLAEYGGEPWWFEEGMSWGDGVVYPHGYAHRFYEYHLDRAFGDMSRLAQASERLRTKALRYQISVMRKHASIQGYVITEFTDALWECNGLLDMQRRAKVSPERLAQFNADDVLFATPVRRAARSGESLPVAVDLSHYSPGWMTGNHVRWRLEGHAPIGGLSLAPDLAQGSVGACAPLQVIVPDVEAPERATFGLHWLTSEGAQIAQDAIDVLLYPAQQPAPAAALYAPDLTDLLTPLGYNLVDDVEAAQVLVTPVLTDAHRALLHEGASVLWLADADDALQTWIPMLGLRNRQGTPWQGDWASSQSWINTDRVFDGLPVENMVDFAFLGLTPDHVLIGASPLEFAQNVHAGLFVGWIHKPVALVLERRYGRGRLLACTFRMRGEMGAPGNPLAAHMLACMVEHLAR